MSGIFATLSALFATFGLASMTSSSDDADAENDIAAGGLSSASDAWEAGNDLADDSVSSNSGTDIGSPMDDPSASVGDGAGPNTEDPTAGFGASASEAAFFGEDGQLILEAESGEAEGNWEETTVDDETVMLWDADSSSYGSAPENEAISFDFVVDESGTYSISLHGARVRDVMNASDLLEGDGTTLRTDTGNDVYIKITDLDADEVVVEPTKLFIGLGDRNEELRWGSTFDTRSDGHFPATAEVEAGTNYSLEIIGRSDAFALDRITLALDDRLYDEDIEESPLLTDYIATLPEDATMPDDATMGDEDDILEMV